MLSLSFTFFEITELRKLLEHLEFSQDSAGKMCCLAVRLRSRFLLFVLYCVYEATHDNLYCFKDNSLAKRIISQGPLTGTTEEPIKVLDNTENRPY